MQMILTILAQIFPGQGSLQDAIMGLITSTLVLGGVSVAITAGFFKYIWQPGENWSRAISLAVPFVVAIAAYAFGLYRGYFTYLDDDLYNVLKIAFQVATGKQLIYLAWQAGEHAVNKLKKVPNAPGS